MVIKRELKKVEISYNEFLKQENEESWQDFQLLNQHEKNLALTLLIKEFLPNNNNSKKKE